MARPISDPTAGERARELGAHPSEMALRVDPTDPRYGGEGDATAVRPRRPVGHVLGRRRGERLPAPDPSAPVLRLRGLRRVRRDK